MSGSQQLILGTGAGGVVANYIEDVFSTWLYTGNGSTQTITNGIDLAGQGGLVWLKNRNSTQLHWLFDTLRGKDSPLSSTNTDSVATNISNYFGGSNLCVFNSNGFTTNGAQAQLGTNGNTYASWTFRKQPKFFDVVTYTGTGTSRTVSHSLGSVPGCIIVKAYSGTDAGTANWAVYHRSLGNDYWLRLENTGAALSTGNILWTTTAPTSTEFSVNGNVTEVNKSGTSYVAYLFAHDAGGFGLTGTDNVISCGSYTGNFSTTGPTINLGYEPQWVLIKNASYTGSYWMIYDNMRGWPVGSNPNLLYPNVSDAEVNASWAKVDLLPTGFQIRTTDSWLNQSGDTYIYIAIRRGPMKTPTTGTSVYNAVAYTGDGSTTREISTSITPDLAMTKGRSNNYVPFWCSRLSGAPLLYSSSTDAERLASGFTNGGFRINTNSQAGIVMAAGSGGTANNSNANGADFINWNFRRAPGFFDVVCYTGNNVSARAVNHNLGVAPELVIVKARNDTANWPVYASALGNNKTLYVNLTDASATSGIWGNTTATSSYFYVGVAGDYGINNATGLNYVAYLFASCPGVSKVGSYTGTGTTLQVNCGFTGGVRFVLIKRTDNTGDWYVWDSARGIVSGNDPYLLLNSAASEQSGTDWVDTHSPGFELSNAAGNLVNTNGGTYIFLAIA